MFSNIGRKIKGLAVFLCFIGIFTSLFFGGRIIYYTLSDKYVTLSIYISQLYHVNASLISFLSGVLIIIVGSILSWLIWLPLYGFGQLVDNSDIIRKQLTNKAR